MKQDSEHKTAEWKGVVSDFECSICLQLLYEPVVGTLYSLHSLYFHKQCIALGNCGHDFCKTCYTQLIHSKRSSLCPMCRHPLPHDLAVCLRLKNTIQKLFPEEVAERQKEIEKTTPVTHKRRRESVISPIRIGVEFSPIFTEHFNQVTTLRNASTGFHQNNEDVLQQDLGVTLDWVHLPETASLSNSATGGVTSSHLMTTPQVPPTPFVIHSETSSMGYLLNTSLPPWTPASQDQVLLNSTPLLPELLPLQAASLDSLYTRTAGGFAIGSSSNGSSRMLTHTGSRVVNHGRRLRRVPTRFSPAFQRPPITVPDYVDSHRH
eukprot:g5944.t1